MNKAFRTLALVAATACLASGAFAAEKKTDFKVAWSVYSGWMPWGYAAEHGIIDKWADKYGIDIELVQLNDYIESINQFTAGTYDACGMTNMDALTIPAANGVDTTGLILGDYSNGNDAILLKQGETMADIKGQQVNLVELSVSHYLLARALDMNGMAERDVTVMNTSDADIAAAFMTPDVTAAAVWNPQLSMIKAQAPDVAEVFDSSQIPGEIIDMMAVNTEVLEANPALGKALVGAWFETLALMSADDEAARQARTFMAERSGTDLAGYDQQLTKTRIFYDPAGAFAFASDPALRETMEKVRDFSFDKGLLGEGAPSADVVGMQFADGSTLGDESNVKLRFDPRYVKMAQDGVL
ncbi:putative urea ABC transporter substrate-binding protein [Stutzerimonas azotifigens]|uniref:putative urea ABC transporter substrate-binding protein n=1 Tax=Stutzerimonas azotifigens TaxID=291995 RepID=UPI0004280F02|nr:putative urea ABC transporter substrate-binding protein [Stutzerimonas azotifigens]